MQDLRNQTILGLLVAATAVLSACGDGGSASQGANGATANGGNGGTAAAGAGTNAGGSQGGSGGASAGGNGGTTSTTSGPVPTMIAQCQGHTYACGDLVDNDMDGLVDWQDPDCLGPCDNTEDSYFGGISGQTGQDCFVDCYWDQDSGPGNDDCRWTHKCDPNELDGHPEPISKCAYDEDTNIMGTSLGCAELALTQSDQCHAVCGPLTPNGCDCFGCCELPAGSGKHVWVGSYFENDSKKGTCTIAGVDDPDLCEPCQPVPACYNDCGPCELCIGKKPEDIPPECNPSGSGGGGMGGNGSGGNGMGGSGGNYQQCPEGITPCGLFGQDSCGIGYYCITGCCQPIDEPK